MRSFSVIIPCRKQEHYLLRALASVLPQLIPGTDQIFIVMDGEKIEFGLRERIFELGRVFQSVNIIFLDIYERRGASVARNLALEKSKGNWIKFLDADDLAAPFSFAAMRNAKIQDSIHVITGIQATVHNGIVAGQGTGFSIDDIVRRNPFLLSNSFVRREAATGVNGFDPRIEFEEDWDFWLRLWSKHGPDCFARMHKPFCYYTIDDKERAEKELERSHNVAGVDVREYLALTYKIQPDR